MVRKSLSTAKGFTLVEVIVVAVIVAVLAAVAIPLYLNYVKSSSDNVAMNAAGSAASFCGACKNSNGTASVSGNQLTCSANSATIEIPKNVTIVVVDASTVTAHHAQGDSTFTLKY